MHKLDSAKSSKDQSPFRTVRRLTRFKTTGRRRRRTGFTLIEVVMAVLVLAAASSVFFALLPASLKTGKMVGNHQQASSIVQHKVDQLRGVGWGRLNYTELENAGIVDASPTLSPYSFVDVDGLDEIFVETVATIRIEDETAQIKKVTVTLTWTGSARRQGNGTLTASALIAKG